MSQLGPNSNQLLPCPFCGYRGVYFRRKSDTRKSVTGAVADIAQDWGPSYEVHVSDWRFGAKCYCGRCRASTGYQWGKWHIPTESEIDCYGDIAFLIPEQYDSYEYRDNIVESAISAWNHREVPTARRVTVTMDERGTIGHTECSACHEPVGLDDCFCRHCGRELT